MQILITRKKLAERRNPHLATYQAVPQRLGGVSNELKRNSKKKKKDQGVENKQRKNKVTITKVSLPIAL